MPIRIEGVILLSRETSHETPFVKAEVHVTKHA